MKEFNSFEEAQAYMAEQEEAALARLHPKQRETTWGSFAFRLVDDFPIWTHVSTEQEMSEGEDPGTIAMMEASHARGYRYGMHYSVIEPDGELGSVHIASCWPISEDEFNTAKLHGWRYRGPEDRWFINMMLRIRDEMSNPKFGPDPGQTFHVVEEE